MATLVINVDCRDFVFPPPLYRPPGFQKPLLGVGFRVLSQETQSVLQVGEAVEG